MGVEKCLFLLYCECMGNNRSTLEFRGKPEGSGRDDVEGNNRSTLEFRGYTTLCNWKLTTTVIIDPHWNLEKLIMENWSSLKMVIIDPHWNLELIVNADLLDRIRVIIDPHWNLEDVRGKFFDRLFA